MGGPEHQEQASQSNSSGELSLPVRADVDVAAARARAFQRLYDARVALRAAPDSPVSVTRRDFFKNLGLGAVAVGCLTSVATQGASRVRQLDNGSERQKGAEVSAHSKIGLFLWENVLFQAGHVALGNLCFKLKLPVGNASVRSMGIEKASIERVVEAFERDPFLAAKIYGEAAWLIPISEELLFRVIPSLCLRKEGAHWQVGIPTTLAYAAVHNIVPANAPTERAISLGPHSKISLDYVPLTQFMLGAFCWYLARTQGELAPVLAHIFNNQLGAISLVLGGRQTYQQFEQLLREELTGEG